jgi:exosome complex component RRP40
MVFVLPGDQLTAEQLPQNQNAPIKLGPGLRHIPPSTITPVVAGELCTDNRKNAVWVEYSGGRVSPSLVI